MKKLLVLLVVLFGCGAKDLSHELEPNMIYIRDGMSRAVRVTRSSNRLGETSLDSCSGVIFTNNLILTMGHCTGEGAMAVDGNPAYILKYDEKKDLALLYAFTGSEGYAPLLLNTHPQIADKIFLVGDPALKRVVEIGRVIGWDEKFLWIDVRGGHGASGGGVYDTEGRLVGLTRGFESDGLPIFTHIVKGEDIRAFLQK